MSTTNYPEIIIQKFIEAVVAKVVEFAPNLLANLPTESSAKAELVKLCDRANRIRVRIADAEQNRQIDQKPVLLWLSELRSIAFEAEDLNEEFEARARLATQASQWGSLWSAWHYWSVLSRVEEINNKYNKIYEDRNAQMLRQCDQARAITTTRRSNFRETSSLEGTRRLHGRDEEHERLVTLLQQQDSNSTSFPPVISITGEGGMGKTALARSAFNDPKIRHHFEPLIWVSLSPNPDPVETVKKIIEAINETNCNLSTLEMLQHNLKQLLSRKKFLLVLDGVYTEDLLFWDPVWTPLISAQPGSKVLVTTRNQTTAQHMGSSDQVALTGLDSSSLWLVLKDEAFLQTSTFEAVNKNLESIGKDIAGKCYGSPLAAKLLGRVLCGATDEDEWGNLLRDMPDPDEVVHNILPSLKLSYELLPLHLKRCFAYCSIFPKGYVFDRENLVKLWVSEGLLKRERPRENKTLEDIGRKQFTDLLCRSFFQPCDQQCGRDRYVMPGAIHDLAQSVSVYECARVDHSGVQHGELTMTRYASLCGDRVRPESVNIYDRLYLRTLIVYTVDHAPVKHIQQQELSSNLKFLRSLDLSNCKFDNLHESIGNLTHLRYLNMRGSLFKTLPESICKLLNLQTLELDECYNLKELPKGMSSLVNMRHIGLSLDWEKWDGKDFDSMPPEMGRLTSLQTLSRFAVARRDGCGITELKDLNIRGVLCISKLENVKNGGEATEAMLCGKEHLKFLLLRWSSRKCFNSGNEEEVIRQLKPNSAMKSIWIEGYNGSEFPPWIADPSFRHLETIKLLNCKVCVNLPQVAKLPQLKRLHLQGLDKVKDLNQLLSQSANSVGFQSLELLQLSDMLELETWFLVPNGSLTKLSELFISNCPKLKHISYLPLGLRRFELRNCRALTMLPPTLPSLSNLTVEGVDWKIIWWIQNLTSLTSLSIIKVPDLRSITGAHLSRLSGLTRLKIEECNELKYLARGLQFLTSIKELEISCCTSLELFCNQCLPQSFRFLSINGCRDVERRCEMHGSDGDTGLDPTHSELHTVQHTPGKEYTPGTSSLAPLRRAECPKLARKAATSAPQRPSKRLKQAAS